MNELYYQVSLLRKVLLLRLDHCHRLMRVADCHLVAPPAVTHFQPGEEVQHSLMVDQLAFERRVIRVQQLEHGLDRPGLCHHYLLVVDMIEEQDLSIANFSGFPE